MSAGTKVWCCPRCGNGVPRCGTVFVDDGSGDGGETLDVYQCDTCIVSADLFGEPFDVALTFTVDASGAVCVPGDDD